MAQDGPLNERRSPPTFMTVTVTVGTWNVEWTRLAMKRGPRVAAALGDLEADVLVITEGCADVFPPAGHVIDGGTAWGYAPQRPEHRKVLMWSAEPWTDVDALGSEALPGGRWVAGTTTTALGPIRVVGVCIPWEAAHVSNGRRDRSRWEDHLTYLEAMRMLLATQARPLVVAGDFNQRIPRTRQPERASAALDAALTGLIVPTAGETEHGLLIDHIAHSPDLTAGPVGFVPAGDVEGRLSDHTGATVGLRRAVAGHHDANTRTSQ